jgi:hypothetical protein
VQCAQGGRKLTQFYREVRDIAGALHLRLREARKRRGRVAAGGSLRVYVVYFIWALMCPAEKFALQFEEQNRVCLVYELLLYHRS